MIAKSCSLHCVLLYWSGGWLQSRVLYIVFCCIEVLQYLRALYISWTHWEFEETASLEMWSASLGNLRWRQLGYIETFIFLSFFLSFFLSSCLSVFLSFFLLSFLFFPSIFACIGGGGGGGGGGEEGGDDEQLFDGACTRRTWVTSLDL